ncbi:hypothetical protein SAMD00019534_100740 [Acytostelium subglobosum LB1]|uniref:hypothetical protein n=1 Tax=Acytostelium subglobosum LB1 TaxID=1410327 RepID=UPI000644FB75|nr:hypothetical protein SAMD00019534_100740 [Acytostelium subglobosum LB1]GAM26899.1 hypothetical protein SAMD00019534_100740 [Acytostelium subglobosum LB1]|eukprot:XP_012750167.1 hypothetical protein SAMD00019534_100740 [Acytostelium subglobosum LB1]
MSKLVESIATRGWLTQPCSLDMLKLLDQEHQMTSGFQEQLILKAIELGITPVVHYFVDPWAANPNRKVDMGSKTILTCCCKHGRLEYFDMILPHVLNGLFANRSDYEYDDWSSDKGIKLTGLSGLFSIAIIHGHLHIAKRLHQLMRKYEGFNTLEHIISSIDMALIYGHLDMVNFILGIKPSRQLDETTLCLIDDVHPNILSVDLLKRLMAHPNLKCRFAKVLGEAIMIGDKQIKCDVIKWWQQTHHGMIETDYRYALSCALEVCDVYMIQWTKIKLSKTFLDDSDYVVLLKHVGVKISEQEFLMLARDERRGISDNNYFDCLMKAASMSLSVITLIIDHFNTPHTTNHPSCFSGWFRHPVRRLSIKDTKDIIEVIIKRGDTDSLDYLIKLPLCRTPLMNIFNLNDLVNIEHGIKILKYLIDSGYINTDKLPQLIDHACINGDLEIMHKHAPRTITK